MSEHLEMIVKVMADPEVVIDCVALNICPQGHISAKTIFSIHLIESGSEGLRVIFCKLQV